MDEIGERLYRRHARELADVLIRPDVGAVPWFDFFNPQQLIHHGLEAGRASLTRWIMEQSIPIPRRLRFCRAQSCRWLRPIV